MGFAAPAARNENDFDSLISGFLITTKAFAHLPSFSKCEVYTREYAIPNFTRVILFFPSRISSIEKYALLSLRLRGMKRT